MLRTVRTASVAMGLNYTMSSRRWLDDAVPLRLSMAVASYLFSSLFEWP